MFYLYAVAPAAQLPCVDLGGSKTVNTWTRREREDNIKVYFLK